VLIIPLQNTHVNKGSLHDCLHLTLTKFHSSIGAKYQAEPLDSFDGIKTYAYDYRVWRYAEYVFLLIHSTRLIALPTACSASEHQTLSA
jgi:hypothetical protein